jgi:two-component system, NtrC family, response regulator AtoC
MSLQEGFKNILVIDDEENMRHMLRAVLNKAGFRAVEAADGEQALELIGSEHFDLALCDVRMPKMDGMRFLYEAQKKPAPPLIIMMSAYGDRKSALDAVRAGAYDYISKPFDKEDLLLTVRKAEERESLVRDNRNLKLQVLGNYKFDNIVGRGEKMTAILDYISKIAPYKTSVLITGESGTGKELIARALHNGSPRAEGPFVPINCGAIPETLLESELFGHARGAYTGAIADKTGLFEEASGGTLFLDEIGEMPFSLQVKLLRSLQEEEIQRLGDTKPRKIDVRVVAATSKDLEHEASEGNFREDLFFRLNVFQIALPPLRERTEDILYLVDHFISKYNSRFGKRIAGPEESVLRLLVGQTWRGNVRELENAIERAVILAEGEKLILKDFPEQMQNGESKVFESAELSEDELSIKKAVRRIEHDLIEKALEKTGGNKTRAAKHLEISHRALLYKIKEYNIEKKE